MVMGNVALVGFAVWAILDQYPPPNRENLPISDL